MKTILIVVLVAIFFFELGTHLGEIKGQQMAIDSRHPSEQLELACAGLWIGEQNKKYWKAQQGF